jgi:multicomponent Na+:H+ antiporter subunit A
MLLGAFLALTQRDLKAILAYTTISALGTLMLLIGIDTKLAMKAALIFLIVHAFYKGTLFMVAGAIDKQTGTRDIDKLGNLYRKMPITTLVAVLALLSMAGLPPMLGFISKEIIYDANIQAPHISDFVIVFGVLANVFMVWVSLYFAYNVFFKRTNFSPKEPVKGAIQFWIGPGILALGGLLLGLFPYQFGKKLIQPALSVIQAEELNISLKLWHGFNDIFLLSLFTVIAGVGLFFFRKQVIPFIRWFNKLLFRIDLSAAFFGFIDWIIGFAKKETKLIQHGYHRIYLMVLFVMVGLLGWYQLINTQFWQFNSDVSDASVYVVALSVIIVIATIFTILSQSRMTAIISMGVVGYGIALLYLTFSAIDLAITQLLVETLTVVIFVLVIVKLPRFARLSTRASKIRDAVIALVVGGFMTGVALKAKDIEFKEPISGYFVENSLNKAFGSNVVNVILVDFRALDTLGEITVLMVAALGIVALLKTSNR